MSAKQFNILRMLVAMVIAAVVGQAVVANNALLAFAAVIIAVALMMFFKRRVTDVLADERDYMVAGKAARYTLGIFSVSASIATLALMMLRNDNPMFATVASVLAYATCGMLLLNAVLFKYLSRSSDI